MGRRLGRGRPIPAKYRRGYADTGAQSASVTPPTVTGSATIGGAASASALAAPAVVAGTASVGAPVVQAGAVVTGVGLTRPAPTIGASVTTSALVVAAGITRPAPTIGGTAQAGAAAAPASVVAAAAVGSPVVTGQDLPPSTPTGLTSTAIRSTEVDLIWSASTDDVGVIGYEVIIRPL